MLERRKRNTKTTHTQRHREKKDIEEGEERKRKEQGEEKKKEKGGNKKEREIGREGNVSRYRDRERKRCIKLNETYKLS
ncbi:MAG: hypothetical protein ACTS6G_01810 [Candidatus Hodgkinia cicadicola]